MTKKNRFITIIILLAVVIVGILYFVFRPAQLSTTHDHYRINGLSANIQGKASRTRTVQYRVNQGHKQSTAVRSGSFAINLPASEHQQKVTIYNQGRSKRVTVSAAKALARYQPFASSYHRLLIASRLPKNLQQAAKNPASNPLQRQQQAAQLAAAMARIEKNSHRELLPVHMNNTIRSLPAQKNYQLRVNVQQGQLMGMALIAPLAQLRNTQAEKTSGSFFTTLLLLAQAAGANPSQVLEQFTKIAARANNSRTTSLPVMHSNGIRFSLTASTSDLYVYISK